METADGGIYETPRLLDEYLLFHYGSPEEILPWPFGPREALGFPVRSALMGGEAPRSRALDLGCAVGRSSFELSRFCGAVLGIDYSHQFVESAETLRTTGRLDYRSLQEGREIRPLTALMPAGSQPGRIAFEQGDAMNLRPDLGNFDLVHAANLLCRLTDPVALLRRLPHLVRPGGCLLLTTPCTWLEEFTPPANWPAGSTAEWLEAALAPSFTLESRHDLPFLIREHARKFQWSVALGSVWRRNSPV